MESEGKTIHAAVKQIRTLFEDIGKLLSSSDAMMRELGWEESPKFRNTCISGMSYSIQLPKQWLPYMIFRFFQRNDLRHLVAGISVILDDPDLPQNRVVEPLVSGVVYDYGRGNKVPEDWTYEYASWHPWIRDAKDDGTPTSIDPRREWPKDGITATQLRSFAVPLVSLSNSETLKARVVVPLDRMARQ